MPFKIHLLIICVIIATVFTVWQLTNPNTSKDSSEHPKASAKLITITHASLGLNCRQFSANTNNLNIAPDNVLELISKKCSGLTECTIALETGELGEDTAPDCKPKTLEVEYRCFSYDRPRQLKATTGSLQLKCTNDTK